MYSDRPNTYTLVLLIWIIAVLGLLSYSCKHHPVDADTGPEPDVVNFCHPDTVYFNKELLPLLGASCGRAGCHDANTQQDGVRLTDYESVMETGDVRPGRPENSDLYEVLVDDDPDDRMPPPPNDPLLPEQIERIRLWILQGAQNLDCVEDRCDLDEVTFSGVVLPNLALNGCVSCHGGSSPQGGIRLDTYQTVKSMAESGRLMGAIRHEPGYVPMPKGGGKMDECQADQIERWILDGLPDD